jgi:hypothetical protein
VRFGDVAEPRARLRDLLDAAGGFLGCLAEQQRQDSATLKLALAYAMVMASFTIQHFSVAGLRNLSRADVEQRMASMAWAAPAAG